MNLAKQKTLTRTISFMSFFVAINVICSFLTVVFPLLSVILVIFLPLTSAVVEVNCKDRWFPIYAFATIGLSIVVSLSSIDFTIFYIVPSIFTGYIFGLFTKKNLPKMFSLFIATIIQTFISFAFIPLLKAISGFDTFDFLAKILGISDVFWLQSIIFVAFFLIALIQMVLSFIVVDNELRKFGKHEMCKYNQELIASISSLVCVALSAVFAFVYLPLMYLLIAISFYFIVFVIYFEAIVLNKLCLILDGAYLLVTLVLFAVLNGLFSDGTQFVLLTILPSLISITSILHCFLKKSE